MLTTLQEKKQKLFFSLLDSDNDGYITVGDFKTIGENICIMQRIGLDTSVFRDIDEASEKIWMDIREYITDKKENRCAVAEWLAFSDEQIVNSDEAWYHNYIDAVVVVVFALFDADGDGLMSEREFMSIFLSFRVEIRDVVKCFQQLDQNNDGYIAQGELATAVNEFFRSSEPSSYGNNLFGMIV